MGDLLSKTIPSNYFVYGTLKSPIHAMNLEENIKYIKKKHTNSKIIAIDASLGNKESIGKISIKKPHCTLEKVWGKCFLLLEIFQ